MPNSSSVTAKRRGSASESSHILDPHRRSELLGLLLGILGLLALLSLVSYFPQDPSLNTSAGSAVRNWIGPVGAYFADGLEQAFGWVAYLIPFSLIYAGVRYLIVRPPASPKTKLFGLLVFACSLMTLLEIFPYTPRISGLIRGSGLGGYLLAAGLIHVFSRVGGTIVAAALFITSLFLLTRFSFARSFEVLKARFAFLKLMGLRLSAWREARREARLRHKVEKNRVQGKSPVVVQQTRQISPRIEPEAAPAREPAAEAPSQAYIQPGSTMDLLRPKPLSDLAKPAPAVAAREKKPEPQAPKPPKIVGRGPHAYRLPSPMLLRPPDAEEAVNEEELKERAARLTEKLAEFGVTGAVTQIHPGPVVTTYEFKPEAGIKYSRIVNLADDLCLALKAESILIDRIPGKSTVGIEVPNARRETIHLRELIEASEFAASPSRLTICLGKDITGKMRVAELTQMPHLMIAGSTGSGKSVSINSLIVSILFKSTPAEVKLILIDPKRLELNLYDGIPHLFTSIVTEPKLAANVLRHATIEMEERLKKLAEQGVRNIEQYNKLFEGDSTLNLFDSNGDPGQPLPYLVIVIDELADLMMVDGQGVEESITRLAQMARAVGIHLILSTQRPSVDVITGLIKANLPSRISFRVASKVDSRTILDSNGAEALLGRGDMLFLPPGSARLQRLHGCMVTEKEITKVVDWWKAQSQPEYNEEFLKPVRDKDRDSRGGDTDEGEDPAELDEVYQEAVRLVVESGKASTSLLQRRLRVGYGRAARLIDLMENDGIVSAPDGPKPREVLKRPDWLQEVDNSLR